MPIYPDAGDAEHMGKLFGGLLITRKTDHKPVFQVKVKPQERMVLFQRGDAEGDTELAEEVANAFEVAQRFAAIFGFALFSVDEINQTIREIPEDTIPAEWEKRKDFTITVTNYVTGERVEMVVALSKLEMDHAQ
jgi:hypothetical protein